MKKQKQVASSWSLFIQPFKRCLFKSASVTFVTTAQAEVEDTSLDIYSEYQIYFYLIISPTEVLSCSRSIFCLSHRLTVFLRVSILYTRLHRRKQKPTHAANVTTVLVTKWRYIWLDMDVKFSNLWSFETEVPINEGEVKFVAAIPTLFCS